MRQNNILNNIFNFFFESEERQTQQTHGNHTWGKKQKRQIRTAGLMLLIKLVIMFNVKQQSNIAPSEMLTTT